MRAGFVPAPIFGPLGALTAPGALERRLWGRTGDKSGLWLPRAQPCFSLRLGLQAFSRPPLRLTTCFALCWYLWESLSCGSSREQKISAARRGLWRDRLLACPSLLAVPLAERRA